MARFFNNPANAAIFGIVTLLAVFMGGVLLLGEISTVVEADEPVVLIVEPGESLSQVLRRSSREGLLRHPGLITFLAVLRGDSANIKAGEYVLRGRVSPNDLLDYFVSGRARLISLTIPEGFSLGEIGERVQAKGLGTSEEFLRLAQDPGFIASLELPIKPIPSTLEGFIYPDTYFFHRGLGEARLIEIMVREFIRKGFPPLASSAGSSSMTPYELLILASMIEKETGVGEERALISAVFHNRLAARMRLASDPTVIYGLADFDGNLKRVHLRAKTPYNTYKILGLPPTPIANPGLESIKAAIAPAKVDFLYFVAKGDGTHYFSKDLKTHRKAVWKYQIRGTRNKRKS